MSSDSGAVTSVSRFVVVEERAGLLPMNPPILPSIPRSNADLSSLTLTHVGQPVGTTQDHQPCPDDCQRPGRQLVLMLQSLLLSFGIMQCASPLLQYLQLALLILAQHASDDATNCAPLCLPISLRKSLCMHLIHS